MAVNSKAWTLALGLTVSNLACGSNESPKPQAAKPAATKPSEPESNVGEGSPPASRPSKPLAEASDGALAGLDARVVRAAEVARNIDAQPERVTEILDAAGLKRAEFEDLIFEISAEPSLAQQYRLAMVSDRE